VLRGLEDESFSASQRDREHPHRHHDGEVERGDAGCDFERLTQRVGINPCADVFTDLALHELRDAGREFDDLDVTS
jgi:hypothetical protein